MHVLNKLELPLTTSFLIILILLSDISSCLNISFSVNHHAVIPTGYHQASDEDGLGYMARNDNHPFNYEREDQEFMEWYYENGIHTFLPLGFGNNTSNHTLVATSNSRIVANVTTNVHVQPYDPALLTGDIQETSPSPRSDSQDDFHNRESTVAENGVRRESDE